MSEAYDGRDQDHHAMVTLVGPPLADRAEGDVPASPARFATRSRDAVETLIGTIVHTAVWAMLLQLVLEVLMPGATLKGLIGHTLYAQFPVFALSAFLIWTVLVLLLCVTGRLWLTCGLMLALVLLFSTVNRVKIRLRREPLYPSDIDFLRQPQFLFSMVKPWQVLIGLVVLVVVVITIVRVGRIPTRTFRPIRRAHLAHWWWTLLSVRLVLVTLCIAVLGHASHFNDDGNRLRKAYEGAGVHWAWWYQTLNYQNNTVVGGLLYNMLAEPMREPPGYSRATMAALSDRWTSRTAELNRDRTSSVKDVNVVLVLSEAFSDPTVMKPAKLARDPIPFTRELMQQTTSGRMLAQMFGGGTANMEFEALSSQSLSQFRTQVNTPYQQFVHKFQDYPTVVGYLKDLGHRALAIHPYLNVMYQRERVYKTFGIDAFIDDSSMQSNAKIDDNEFISDTATFREVLWQLDQSRAPVLANVVTMQNHFPWENEYHDPWPVSGITGFMARNLAGYARGLNHTDKALRNFVGDLEQLDEKTAVVFYGDHLPGLWDNEILRRNGKVVEHTTPWFIWTNFKTTPVQPAPVTSPMYFMPLLFEQLGADLPPYYALLWDLYAEVPAMDGGMWFDGSGKQLQGADEVSPRGLMLLEDFRLLQYDFSVGRRYAQDEMFYLHE